MTKEYEKGNIPCINTWNRYSPVLFLCKKKKLCFHNVFQSFCRSPTKHMLEECQLEGNKNVFWIRITHNEERIPVKANLTLLSCVEESDTLFLLF